MPMKPAMTNATPNQRQLVAVRDELGTVRIVNDTTKHTIAALTRREAKQLSRELRRVLKNGSKSQS
jgi:membrane protein YdbS with pleckstrin-like domain